MTSTGEAQNYRIVSTALDRLVVRMIYAQRRPVVGRAARQVLRLFGVDVLGVVGKRLMLGHATSGGFVVNAGVTIGDDVTIMHGVTLGRADVHRRAGGLDLRIGDGAFISTGAVILGSSGRPVTIGAGAVIGANAVVTTDVPAGETWAGNPACRVR